MSDENNVEKEKPIDPTFAFNELLSNQRKIITELGLLRTDMNTGFINLSNRLSTVETRLKITPDETLRVRENRIYIKRRRRA